MGQDKLLHQEGVVKVPIKYVNLWGYRLLGADESLFLKRILAVTKAASKKCVVDILKFRSLT